MNSTCQRGEEKLVSIIVPCWNEVAHISKVIEGIFAIDIPYELIVVDGGSTDGTGEILESIEHKNLIKVMLKKNLGKGGNLKAGISRAKGRIIVHHDADLEYDPADIPRLIQPMVDNEVDLVLGSRFLGSRQGMSAVNTVANILMSWLATIVTRTRITDIASCYKIYFKEWYEQAAGILSNGFSMDVEIFLEGLRAGLRYRELPIRYKARTRMEGKKIGLRDFFVMCRSILFLPQGGVKVER